MTSSALNHYNRGKRRNTRRVIGSFGEPNFGMIETDWNALNPVVNLSTQNLKGATVLSQDIPLDALRVSSS
jgi:hypothetical protein